MRCHSWRPGKCSKHRVPTLPPTCTKCWRPCFRKVPDGAVRCERCETELVQVRSDGVLMALLEEGNASEEALEYLATDENPVIAATASSALRGPTGFLDAAGEAEAEAEADSEPGVSDEQTGEVTRVE